MEREAALADFDTARKEWEDAFARVPDGALTYLKPGDDYALGGLQVHVNWVLLHYRRVLDGIVAARFGELGPQDPPGDEPKAREGARRGLSAAERRKSLDEMARLHDAVSAANHESGDTAFSALRTPFSAIRSRPTRMTRGSSSTSIACAMVV